MNLKLYQNEIKVKFSYDPRIIQFVKNIEGRRYDSAEKVWYIPKYISSEGMDKFRRLGFEIDPEVEEEVALVQKTHTELADLKGKLNTQFTSSLPLYGFQKVGAAFLTKIGSGVLADQIGTGKTIMTLATIENRGTKNNLILCPAILKEQWREEIKKFLPDKEVIVIEGKREERKKLWEKEGSDYYIANYELLLRDQEIFSRDWNYAVADECTRLQNPYAKQVKAIGKIKSKYRLALTGTLISNSLADAWSIINWTHPGLLGSFFSFCQNYTVKNHWGSIIGYKNEEYMKKRMSKFMIRRTKDEVGLQLPAKIESEIPFTLGVKENDLYQKIRSEALFDIEKSEISKIENPELLQMAIVKLTRLRQLCDSMELLGDEKDSTKLEVLKELLINISEGKVILFSQFSKMCKILERELQKYNPLMIIGETSTKERQKIVEQFNNDDEHKILILSNAGEYGLNLQSKANIIIHYDQCWSLARMEQRAGRAYRIGQTKNVLEYHLIAKGSADRYMRQVVKKKYNLSSGFFNTLAGIKEVLKFEE